jgi:hypothetical protein
LQKISSDYKWETFLSISPITGVGVCELSELCERLILSYVRAVRLDKAGGCSLRAPAPLRKNSKSYWIFLRLAGLSFVRSDRSASSQSKQNYLARRRRAFSIGQYWFIDICGGKLLGRVDLRVDHGHFGNHMNIQESRGADNPVRLSRIGTRRHGGRPSHEQQANPTLPS